MQYNKYQQLCYKRINSLLSSIQVLRFYSIIVSYVFKNIKLNNLLGKSDSD